MIFVLTQRKEVVKGICVGDFTERRIVFNDPYLCKDHTKKTYQYYEWALLKAFPAKVSSKTGAI